MRPAEFAPEAIIQAGEDLQTAGRNITGFALRQKVGGGNPSRLKQVWDEHLASRSMTRVEPVAELPIEVAEEVAAVTKALTERLGALAVELNDKAVKAAERRVHEVVRSAGEQREQAERELADASQTVEDIETKLDQTQAEADALEIKLADTQKASQTQAIELAQLRERLTATEQSAKAASGQHTAELARMNATIEAEQTRHQQETQLLRSELADQKQATQVAIVDRDQARAELAIVKAKAEVTDQAHQEQRKATADEEKRNVERITKFEADQAQTHKEASAAREDAAKLRGQVEAMQAQLTELTRALADRQARETPNPQKK
jgi:colicin import membrane protein